MKGSLSPMILVALDKRFWRSWLTEVSFRSLWQNSSIMWVYLSTDWQGYNTTIKTYIFEECDCLHMHKHSRADASLCILSPSRSHTDTHAHTHTPTNTCTHTCTHTPFKLASAKSQESSFTFSCWYTQKHTQIGICTQTGTAAGRANILNEWHTNKQRREWVSYIAVLSLDSRSSSNSKGKKRERKKETDKIKSRQIDRQRQIWEPNYRQMLLTDTFSRSFFYVQSCFHSTWTRLQYHNTILLSQPLEVQQFYPRRLCPASEVFDIIVLGLYLHLHHRLLLLQVLYMCFAALTQSGNNIFMLRAILLRGLQAFLQVYDFPLICCW